MGKKADMLRELAKNPDDLSKLPEIITEIELLEDSETQLMERVDKLHEANKRYLKMMTVSEPKEEQPKEPEKLPPTMKDMIDTLVEGVK